MINNHEYSRNENDRYVFEEHVVYLQHNECDIRLVFPNGEIAEIQYRLESPSIDICFPTELSVANWKGDDMEPADSGPSPEIHDAKQLMICFPPEWLDRPLE